MNPQSCRAVEGTCPDQCNSSVATISFTDDKLAERSDKSKTKTKNIKIKMHRCNLGRWMLKTLCRSAGESLTGGCLVSFVFSGVLQTANCGWNSREIKMHISFCFSHYLVLCTMKYGVTFLHHLSRTKTAVYHVPSIQYAPVTFQYNNWVKNCQPFAILHAAHKGQNWKVGRKINSQ